MLIVAAAGVIVSVCLAAAAALTLGDGDAYGPGITKSSIAFAGAFFLLNPLHFLLFILSGIRMPDWLFWSAAPVIDVGWWLLVGRTAGSLLEGRRQREPRR